MKNPCIFLTQCPYRTGLLGRLALLRPRPRYVSCHPWATEVLWRQNRGLRSGWWDLHWRRSSSFLVGVGNLIGVCGRTTSRNQDGLANCGRGPVPLSRGGGEERPWGGVVRRRTSGGGAAGRRGGRASTSNWTSWVYCKSWKYEHQLQV